jgi:hypothetical protein
MKVSFESHATAALPLRKWYPAPTAEDTAWVRELWTRKKMILSMSGIVPPQQPRLENKYCMKKLDLLSNYYSTREGL